MRTSKQTRQQGIKITTGKVWTSQHRKVIRSLTKGNAPIRLTQSRLQSLLSTFRTRAKKLAKAANGRKRH